MGKVPPTYHVARLQEAKMFSEKKVYQINSLAVLLERRPADRCRGCPVLQERGTFSMDWSLLVRSQWHGITITRCMRSKSVKQCKLA
jgi:hypothetical protein